MNAVDQTLTHPNGQHLRVRRWDSPITTSEILLLPGRGDPVEKYDGIAQELLRLGAGVLGVDWFGQGRSSRDDAPLGALHVDSFDRYQRDLVLASAGLDPTRPRLIVAYSMGGLIALRALADRALRADEVVLIRPMLRFRGAPPETLTSILADVAIGLGKARNFAAGERWTPPAECTLETNMAVDDPAAFAHLTAVRMAHPEGLVTGSTWGCARAATREMAAVRRLSLDAVTMPVTIFWSDDDRSVDPKEHAALAARLPHACLATLTGRHDLLAEGGGTGRTVERFVLDRTRALGGA